MYPFKQQPKGSLAESIVKVVREATPDLTNFHSRHRMLVFPPGTDIESATDRAQGLLGAGFQGLQEAALFDRGISDSDLRHEAAKLAARLQSRDQWFLGGSAFPQQALEAQHEEPAPRPTRHLDDPGDPERAAEEEPDDEPFDEEELPWDTPTTEPTEAELEIERDMQGEW